MEFRPFRAFPSPGAVAPLDARCLHAVDPCALAKPRPWGPSGDRNFVHAAPRAASRSSRRPVHDRSDGLYDGFDFKALLPGTSPLRVPTPFGLGGARCSPGLAPSSVLPLVTARRCCHRRSSHEHRCAAHLRSQLPAGSAPPAPRRLDSDGHGRAPESTTCTVEAVPPHRRPSRFGSWPALAHGFTSGAECASPRLWHPLRAVTGSEPRGLRTTPGRSSGRSSCR